MNRRTFHFQNIVPIKLQFRITEYIRRNRLDKFLFEEIRAVSKIYLLNLLKDEKCRVNGAVQPGGYHLKKDDRVEIEVDLNAETAMKPENIPLEIVFEDEEIVVVNKQSGLLVHPTLGQKNGTLLNALNYYLNFKTRKNENSEKSREILPNDNCQFPDLKSEIIRPGLIHRIDRQTSGLMVIAKTSRALRVLNSHFQRRLVEKKYLALVEGVVDVNSGTIDAPIGKFLEEKRWDVKADGKNAETRFRVLERFPDKTLLELEPITGRTNQLRIHCAFVGHPILGDQLFNGRKFSRLCLHAARLAFWHPNGHRQMEFESRSPFETI